MAKLMVIDDDVEQADDLSAMLRDSGHTVSAYHKVEGAVDQVVGTKPDLVVLDVMFPEDAAGGLKLAIDIRKRPEARTLPIVILTNVNQEFPLGLSAKDIDPTWLPVQDLIEKPVDLQRLLRKIDDLLARPRTPAR